MTLQQEAVDKLYRLPDVNVRYVIALMDEMLKQLSLISATDFNVPEKSASAFQDLMEFRRTHTFPENLDVDKIREEAMVEKYGRFD